MQPELCDQLAELQGRRKFYIRLIGQQTNAAKALIRRALGFQWDADEAARSAIAKRATRILTAALAGKELVCEHCGTRKLVLPTLDDETTLQGALHADLAKFAESLAPLEKARHEIELEMARIARKLPVAEWREASDRKGFGVRALAVLIGEAGDLSKYANPAKLWKRLGLAPYEGKACSTWRREGGLSAEEWTLLGYSPRRRAEVYAVLAEPLFKHQTMIGGPYRAVYDRRRARTAETHPDWSKLRSHMDALRIMSKQAVLDLWVEWRRAKIGEKPKSRLPAANLSADEAGRPALADMHPVKAMPDAELATAEAI